MERCVQIPVNQFETFADGLDHAEDLAFDSEGILWAGGEIGQIYRIPDKGKVVEITNGSPSASRNNCSSIRRNSSQLTNRRSFEQSRG